MSSEHGFVLRTKPEEALDFVERWIYTPALRELVEADGGLWPTGSLSEVVAELEEFSKVWDFRGGKSRLIFKDGDESRTDDRANRIYSAVRSLGLLDPPPPTLLAPDYLLILGGLATGVEPRVRHAAELVNNKTIHTRVVVALGSFRVLFDRELPVAESYAPGSKNESDLLRAVLDASFAGDGPWVQSTIGDPLASPRHAESIIRRDGTLPLVVFSARSGQPDLRPANTVDTYLQFAAYAQVRAGESVLVITSTIYAAFQHIDAIRILGLGFGVKVESIGVPSSDLGPSHPPSAYLQEIRSGLRSVQKLLDATIA